MGFMQLQTRTKAEALNELVASRDESVDSEATSSRYCTGFFLTRERCEEIAWVVEERHEAFCGVYHKPPVGRITCLVLQERWQHWWFKPIDEAGGPS